MNAQFLPLFLLCLLLLLRPNAASLGDPPSPSPASTYLKDVEFIKKSCQKTTYPDFCFTTVFAYGRFIRQDPAKLADYAVQLSILNVTDTGVFFKEASEDEGYKSAASLLQDCHHFFDTTANLLNTSLNQLRGIGGSAEVIREQVNRLQSTMSSASTIEGKCPDGFKGMPDGPIKKEVTDLIHKANEFTCNAIDLVDNYVVKFKTT